MKTLIDYDRPGMSQEQKDATALMDMQKFLGLKKFDLLVEVAKSYNAEQTANWVAFAGVTGYPLHAFIRTYKRVDYDAWVKS